MKVVISGATGFLGKNLALRLKGKGHEVVGLGRNLDKGRQLEEQGVKFVPCSLDQKSLIAALVEGADWVVHSAALSSPWGSKEAFFKANVEGTQNLVEICLEKKVKRFVHVSSPSLYFKFQHKKGLMESDSIEPPHASLYTHSKYHAEKVVDQAVREKGLPAITIRPRGIFGPGDESIFGRIVSMAESKQLKQVGSGDNWVDITYVDNVSQAIELALEAPGSLNGQKYNITNGEPVRQWPFINNVLGRLGYAAVKKKVPYKVASSFAFLLETLYRLLPLKGEPRLTRYTVGLLYFDQTLDIEKARKELGYVPEVSMAQAVENIVKTWGKN